MGMLMFPFCGVSTRGGGDPWDMNPCCEGAGEKGDGDWVATRFGAEFVCELND
jgi:hypothetical protein